MEEEGNDSQALREVAGADHQEKIQSEPVQQIAGGQKQDESAGNQPPYQRLGSFPFAQVLQRKPAAAPVGETPAEIENIHEHDEGKAQQEQRRQEAQHHLNDLRRLFFERRQA